MKQVNISTALMLTMSGIFICVIYKLCHEKGSMPLDQADIHCINHSTGVENGTKQLSPEEDKLHKGSMWPANTRISHMLQMLEDKPMKLLDDLLKESLNPQMDDPRLVDIIRMLVYPPAKGIIKRSHHIRATPQAEAIMQVLDDKRKGFFVECGGLDGERASNTFHLETHKKWSGLLVEMDPLFFLQLLGKNRNSHALHSCLSPNTYPGKLEYRESEAGTGRLQGGTGKKVTCFPLYSIMLALGQTVIHYFSLDVEGQELGILQTIPFDKLDIKVLSVEYNHLEGNNTNALLEFMATKGYEVFKKIDYIDETVSWYIHDYIFAKPELLKGKIIE